MVTRRQTLFGLISAAAGGAALSAGAFSSSVAADADMRVVVVSDLRLVPGRDGEDYVKTDDEGLVEEIVLQKLNSSATSRFADLVRIVNEGTVAYDELSFEFEVSDGDRQDGIEETLQVTVLGRDIDADGSDRVAVEDDALDPGGDGVPFGLLVNLIGSRDPGEISNLPDEPFEVELKIRAYGGEGD